ncbi:transcription factor [Cyanidiococcus yangmingshanensis]|uniref:Transcription factor n=1 Tax=Cyanidiococcus yangmingshanensis TaxID=2690220 RepID=A0A7J7IQ68_9RHOD|nr:transcription factor [Cyanidiococcus yangmingshanensis]
MSSDLTQTRKEKVADRTGGAQGDIEDRSLAAQRRDHGENYAWERRYERSWDVIEVSEASGKIFRRDSLDQQRNRHRELKRLLADPTSARSVCGIGRSLGLIRFLVFALDLSAAVRSRSRSSLSSAYLDLKPSRWVALLSGAQYFVREFFNENAVSQLALVILQEGIATQVTEMSGSARLHLDALNALRKGTSKFLRKGDGGQASLQNCLELGHRIHATLPRFGTREMLIIYGALSTCDPNDIHQTIQGCVLTNIQVSIIGLGAEVFILRATAERTGGTYRVPVQNDHFRQLLRQQVRPPQGPGRSTRTSQPDSQGVVMRMVMGFPPRLARERLAITIDTRRAHRLGFECPQCRQWLSEVPGNCILCGLTLTSALHLARSYHHIFPASLFEEYHEFSSPSSSSPISSDDTSEDLARVRHRADQFPRDDTLSWQCSGCLRDLPISNNLRLQCSGVCKKLFCIECDQLVHERTHICPGCLAVLVGRRKELFSQKFVQNGESGDRFERSEVQVASGMFPSAKAEFLSS